MMGTIDMFTHQGLQRLRYVPASNAENRVVKDLPGASVANESINFAAEPLLVEDILTAFPHTILTPRTDAWYQRSMQHARLVASYANAKDSLAITQAIPWADRLYPYQRVGAAWLLTAGRGILGDDVGMGKTVQALTAASRCHRVLIVTTTDPMKYHWQDHAKRWLGRTATVAVGSAAQRQRAIADAEPWLIINHEMLRNAHIKFPALVGPEHPWDAVIIDEAHKFQGRNSQQSAGAAMLATQRLYLLTATPVWNRPDSIWSLLNLLDPSRFSSYWNFVNEYCEVAVSLFGTEIGGIRRDKVARLHRVLAQYLLKRDKAEYLPELPAKVRETISYEPTAAQWRMYRTLRNSLRLADEQGDIVRTYASMASAIATLRYILDTPMLATGGHTGASPKDEVIDDLLQSSNAIAGGTRKAIVYTWHQNYANYLAQRLVKHGVVLVTGSTGNSTELFNQFRRDPDKHVLVATIGVAGTGIDLIEASVAIFAEGAYVPTLNEQAEGRLHRIGQKTDVTIYRLQARHTIEQHIWDLSDDRADITTEMLALKEILALMAQED